MKHFDKCVALEAADVIEKQQRIIDGFRILLRESIDDVATQYLVSTLRGGTEHLTSNPYIQHHDAARCLDDETLRAGTASVHNQAKALEALAVRTALGASAARTAG